METVIDFHLGKRGKGQETLIILAWKSFYTVEVEE